MLRSCVFGGACYSHRTHAATSVLRHVAAAPCVRPAWGADGAYQWRPVGAQARGARRMLQQTCSLAACAVHPAYLVITCAESWIIVEPIGAIGWVAAGSARKPRIKGAHGPNPSLGPGTPLRGPYDRRVAARRLTRCPSAPYPRSPADMQNPSPRLPDMTGRTGRNAADDAAPRRSPAAFSPRPATTPPVHYRGSTPKAQKMNRLTLHEQPA